MPRLGRLCDLLEKGSPLLISGCFTKALPMGCLASHIAWHHPRTCGMTIDAGLNWLHQVAGLNPATSAVLREWDLRGIADLPLRQSLLSEFRAEQERRQGSAPPPCRDTFQRGCTASHVSRSLTV